MAILTLAERLYGRRLEEGRQALASILKDALKGLEVDLKILGVTRTGWARVEVEGPDGEVAEALIRRIVGTVPTRLAELKDCMDYRGRVARLEEGSGILMNVGIEEPEVLYAILSLQSLRRQLADGRSLGVMDLANFYGLHEGLPLEVHVLTSGTGFSGKPIEVELTDRQLENLFTWRSLGLDRVLVVGATLGAVRKSIRIARCEKYILRIERLGILENAVICKMGTEAPGIVHAMARAIPEARLYALRGRRYTGAASIEES